MPKPNEAITVLREYSRIVCNACRSIRAIERPIIPKKIGKSDRLSLSLLFLFFFSRLSLSLWVSVLLRRNVVFIVLVEAVLSINSDLTKLACNTAVYETLNKKKKKKINIILGSAFAGFSVFGCLLFDVILGLRRSNHLISFLRTESVRYSLLATQCKSNWLDTQTLPGHTRTQHMLNV